METYINTIITGKVINEDGIVTDEHLLGTGNFHNNNFRYKKAGSRFEKNY